MNVRDSRWIRLTSCQSIPVREGRAIDAGGRQIAVFNLGDSFLAVESRCPHRGGPLADGILCGSSVVCPLHAWTFDLETGRVKNHPESRACLATFPVRIEAGIVSVQLPAEPHDADSEPAVCDHPDRPVRWVQRKPPVLSADHSSAAGAAPE
jgi:nitrite reductase (NADH) small subunit